MKKYTTPLIEEIELNIEGAVMSDSGTYGVNPNEEGDNDYVGVGRRRRGEWSSNYEDR